MSEIPAELRDNPLLRTQGLPAFCAIRPEHVEPAIRWLLEDNRRRLAELLAGGGPWTWQRLAAPIEALEERLARAWSPVRHLNSVLNSPELRAAYNACLPLLSEYHTELGQNEDLYRAYRALAEGPEFARLDDAARRRSIENALRDFRLSGVDLPPAGKRRYAEIARRLSELTARYEENVLDATHAWTLHLPDASRLAGLPDSALALAEQTARQRDLDGYLLTLEFPSYFAVVTYADDRDLRRQVYRAYATRASDQGDHPEWDNGPLMEEILALRHEKAQLLGFANFAELSLYTKMAESPQAILDFLHDLARRSRPRARQELDELRAFARDELGIAELAAWDVAYAGEKLRQRRFDFSEEDLKPYFPVDRVLEGLFTLVKRLYGIDIRPLEGVEVWHPDVRFYEVFDRDGSLRAGFYLDLYARPQKRGGAWMDECLARRGAGEDLQVPVAYMTCNATPPVGDKPALFTHDEVTTLFHEFGHGLHHMLTRIDVPSVGGISGVEWDAVELPSQFMENWCWQREALDLIAGHYETGERLPDALFDKLTASRHFHAALQMVRQLEFALFDLRIHLEYDPARGGRVYEILDEVRREVAVIQPPPWNRFAHSFSHIFAGGYAAGYYSYKWAEVLSADAFARFEEEGLFDPDVGEAFRTEILEVGGSRPAMESFRAFRGRAPSIDALLRHSGLAD